MKVEGGRVVHMMPEDAREVARYVAAHHAGDGSFELVLAGETPGEDRKEGVRIVAAYEKAGVTWWIESIDPWRFGWTEGEPWPSEEMRRRVRQGPPERSGRSEGDRAAASDARRERTGRPFA